MIKIDFTTKPEFKPEYIIDQNGTQHLYDQNGKYHSYNDMPAVVNESGYRIWFKHGEIYRDNGLPICISLTGEKFWLNKKNPSSDTNNTAVVDQNGKEYILLFYKKGIR